MRVGKLKSSKEELTFGGKMRLNAKQVDADLRQARQYVNDALREAVCRWIDDNKASRARTARAFGISAERVGTFEFETMMRKHEAERRARVRNEPMVTIGGC